MKTCPVCYRRKPVEEFNWKYKAKGVRCSTCRECMRIYIRQHYQSNVDYYVKKAMRRKKAYIGIISKRVFNYLSTPPCVDCGEIDPIVLEFDHIDSATKISTISEMVQRQRPWEKIMDEISKCEVRCANCHRRRTAKQQGWSMRLAVT